MASDLKENVSSDTIAAYNGLQPKTAAKRIVVYVESDEDISFWRNMLHGYENNKIEFDIQTPDKKGKQKAIEKGLDILDLKVGQFLIVCVDSDYDYLLPEYSPQSKLVNENSYVFQTYTYSIENLQCYSESLHALCVQSTKHDKKLINFNELLKAVSKIIYPLFLWNLYFRKSNDHAIFTISDFCEIIKLTDKIDVNEQFSTAIDGLKTSVDAKVALLEKDYPDAMEKINKLAKELEPSGLNSEQTYLFIQGHTLKDNIVLMVLKPVCQLLVNEKFEAIKVNNAQNKMQEENERNHYKNQRQDISVVLNSNTEFKNCFLYKKIKTDVDRYVATFN